MDTPSAFLQDLALVLCVAAVITLLFHRLRQPPVLGYLLAGLILGPHVPLPLFAHEDTVRTLAELGVILVMFSIGLEFSVGRLLSVLPTAGLTSLIEISVMAWLGFAAGHLMGWTFLECVFTGAIVAVSSTMIASKFLLEQREDPKLSGVVFGILVVQDLVAVLLLALLTPMAEGAGLSFSGLVGTLGNFLGFLGILFGAGYLIIPRVIRAVAAFKNSETLLITSVGVCFALALLAQRGGYSVALGAFLAGMLVAESGASAAVERLVSPLRDMFGSVFFVAVGMLVNPGVLLGHWRAVLVLTAVVVVGQILSVSVGAFLSGRPLKTALQAGMSLAHIGEFSFILVQMGVAKQAISGYLYDVTVAVAVVTAFAAPWLIKLSGPLSRLVDSRLPRPLQTFTALYGSWLEGLRVKEKGQTLWHRSRRLAGSLLLDTLCLVVITITTAVILERWPSQLQNLVHLPPEDGKVLLLGVGLVLAIPFCVGVLRGTQTLGALLASASIPTVEEGKLDLGLAPRRVLTLTLRLGIVLALGLAYLALTQPFLPFGYSPLLLAAVLLALGVVFWKSAVNLQDHVKAGAQMVAEALSVRAPKGRDEFLEQVNAMVPGIGAPTTFSLEPQNPVVGKTLGDLNLRSLTGASVIAITRGKERLLMPSGKETLQAGDKLVLVGTQEAVKLAETMLERS